ncbi:cytoskeleton protein RodZ [Vibrio sonorensis]|uniref:cytoskeleton protein RodZ n=1 Tax=Vibrio sonorensis TaxID=1004316 RepID=UPI0008D9749F|nr:cytoskeleton protein RodZ [Vibrio sonorensis]
MIAENETVAEETKIQPGDILKARRETLGLTQKQIADRLRLRLSIIENIELNQFESDQVATFTRGYLKSYARAVGADEIEVLAALDSCTTVEEEEHTMQSFSQQTDKERSDSRIMKITWVIVVIIFGISTLWWWQNQQNTQIELTAPQEETSQASTEQTPTADFVNLEEEDRAETETTISQVSEVAEEATPQVSTDAAEEPAAEVVEAVTEAPVESVDEPAVEESVVEEVTSSQVEATDSDSAAVEVGSNVSSDLASLLEMSFDSDCWIQVKDASGKTLSTGLKKAGQSLQLSGKAPFKVVLGAPEGVSITFASEPVDLSGYTSGKVARFTLP